jgi:hypothetical protein
MHAIHTEPVASSEDPDEKLIVLPQRRRSLADRWDELTFRIYQRIREWRELSPNTDFPSTRDYAWRQAVPAAAGLAIAFALGWVLALANSRNQAPLHARPASVSAPAPANVQPAVTATPAATPVRSARAKPSPAVRKSTSKVSRRRTREVEAEEPDVVIVRHPPKRQHQLVARANQKNGVKTISDME